MPGTYEKSKTENLRLDMLGLSVSQRLRAGGARRWVVCLPGLRDSDPSQFRGLDRVIAGAVHQLYQSGKLQNIDFTLDFKGDHLGTGFALAGDTATGSG